MAKQSKLVRRWEWTRQSALVLAAACLAAGIGGGWAIRSAQMRPGRTAAGGTAAQGGAAGRPEQNPAQNPSQNVDPLKQAADQQAAPLLEKLKSNPDNAEVLVNLGNLYDDAKQYPAAVERFVSVIPMGRAGEMAEIASYTALWFLGRADDALKEFDTALGYSPTSANTLFNRGIVRWKGKADGKGAMADFEKLMQLYPNYEARDQVQQLETEIRQSGAVK
jgi:tetratricopeptide (TPR) repeat protein